MRYIPLVSQCDAMDCGPSCLAMLAMNYGRQLDRKFLRQRCALGKRGVSLLGISKTAEEIGFKTIGGQLGFETLSEFLLIYNDTLILYLTHYKSII